MGLILKTVWQSRFLNSKVLYRFSLSKAKVRKAIFYCTLNTV